MGLVRNGLTALRSGAWLDADRVRGYLIILAVVNLLSLAWLVLGERHGLDAEGRLLGTDFVSFWAAGKVLHGGGNPYDIAAHAAAQRTVWVTQTGYTAYFYPPIFLLWCWLLGAVGYFAALAGWVAVTGAAYIAGVRAWLGRLPVLAIVAFPPVMITITHGQTSFLLAALLGGAFWLAAQQRTLAAGVLLGLATFKPQFGVLVPVVLLAAREWRLAGWAGLTALALAGLTVMAFGVQIWPEWQAVTGPAQQSMANGAIGFAKMQSLFSAVRLWGGPIWLATGLQGALALAVAAVLGWLAWMRGLTLEVGAATITGALLATPFLLDYDLALLAFPLILMLRSKPLPWERTAGALVFAMPAFARPLAMSTGVAIGPFLIAVLFALLARRTAVGAQYPQA